MPAPAPPSGSAEVGAKAFFTEVDFRNYKAFKSFRLHLNDFNVMVGPNNAGKSTVLGAFRILAEGMRRGRSRTPELIRGPRGNTHGYPVKLDGLPVSTENVFHNYDDSEAATVTFSLSNGNKLILYFPQRGACYLLTETIGRPVRQTAGFKREFDAAISFVPVLGPVDHNEPLYQREAARTALLSHGASRNFRNIWHHFPESFADFRTMIRETWPGMDINAPEVSYDANRPTLHMFCPEDRYPREIFWAGFGFQVWCQMLTFLVQAKNSSLVIIDEPDIYLHADLQRQLVSILKNLGPDVLIATHSTEIISEVSPRALLSIDKRKPSASRIKNVDSLNRIFEQLGSSLNPALSQLAKTRRLLLVEGKDFQVIARFARLIGETAVANRSFFAVIPVEGFNPERARHFVDGVASALGSEIKVGIVFDRDYRSDPEIDEALDRLSEFAEFAIIHQRKEIENYLLAPPVIHRALLKRAQETERRTGTKTEIADDVRDALQSIGDGMKNEILAHYLERRERYERGRRPGTDSSVFKREIMDEFDRRWNTAEGRQALLPGKEVISKLNAHLQERYGLSLSRSCIIDAFRVGDVPSEMRSLIQRIAGLQAEGT